MPTSRHLAGWGAALIAAGLLLPPPARAADPFEIQVYDGTAEPPGVPALELHVNHVGSGVNGAPPAAPSDGITHFTLEPSLGLTPWCELGGYLQAALRADGTFDFAGVKLRAKFVTPPAFYPHAPHVRLGLNVELSWLPAAYEPDHWDGELRPIAAWEDARWLLAVNPIIGTPLAGAAARSGPTLEPAATAVVKVRGVIGLGLEYYASLGPIGGFHAARDQEHYVFEVVNLLAVRHLELNVGVGEGLTAGSNGWIVKTIVGWSLEPAAPRPGPSH